MAFSPQGGCQHIIVAAIHEARHQVLVQAYGFTNKGILKALVEAKHRGVDVRVLLDKSNEQKRYTGATYMMNAGVPVWIDYRPAIAHNKVMIIDRSTVITGSFNFTKSAQQRNAPALVAAYIKNWEWRREQSGEYRRRQ